jgi:hypothetical protein
LRLLTNVTFVQQKPQIFVKQNQYFVQQNMLFVQQKQLLLTNDNFAQQNLLGGGATDRSS